MRTVFSVIAFSGILSFIAPCRIFSYSILIDASCASQEQIPGCINFIVETRDMPYSIVLPDGMEPWEEKIVHALGEKSNYRIVCKMKPQIWLRGVETLGVSDIDDILIKTGRRFSKVSGSPPGEIFIGPQTVDEETAVRIKRHGVKTVYCAAEAGNSGVGLNVALCRRVDNPAPAEGNILYDKTDSFDELEKFMKVNPPVPFDFSTPFSTGLVKGIVLDSVNLKLWELFVNSRRALDDYKNSGSAEGEKLAAALEIVYSIEDVSNWKDNVNTGGIFRSISDIYNLIGTNPPYEFGSISDIFFDDLKELPVSVEVPGFEYSIGEKDGFLHIAGSFETAFSTSIPVEIYWWNPAMIFSAREGIAGAPLSSPVNFCLFLMDKCYFYSSSRDGWQRLWSVFDVERSSKTFLIKVPLSYFQLAEKNSVSFLMKFDDYLTGPLAVSLPRSYIYKKWLDMVGDAKGPGWYELPADVPSGMGDIMSVSAWENSSRTFFQFYFAGPLWDEKWSAGFDLYIDINGIKKRGNGACRQGLNCWVSENAFWEFCLSVSPSGAVLSESGRKTDASLKFDSSKRIATVELDKNVFACGLQKCQFTFCSYLLDADNILEIKEVLDERHPGGGKPSLKSPNVLDIIAGSSLQQKQVLGDYLKKRGVQIPALP
ncbi:MAG: glucodextranase DOMON-like domain-containing protein [bacterium]